MALACSDTSLKEILIFIFAGFNIISSLTTVLISSLHIVAAILRIQSAEGRRKASSTCGSHLTAVTVFYGTLIFMYLQPKSNHSLDTDEVASVVYTIVIPTLNPMIYSLRNQEVKNALRKAFKKCYFLFLSNVQVKGTETVDSQEHHEMGVHVGVPWLCAPRFLLPEAGRVSPWGGKHYSGLTNSPSIRAPQPHS